MTNAPLRGFLESESDGEVRIAVPSGTWIIKRTDIERQSAWEDAQVVHGKGQPVEIVVRPGASIGLLHSVTVQPLERP